MTAPRLRPALAKLHRWLSLGVMALWLVQALSGMICVFHWELDDAGIGAADRPLDLGAMARRIAVLAPPGSGRRVTELWSSAGGRGRWDLTVTGSPGAIVRVDGAGAVLRVRREGDLLRDGGLLDSIDNLHQNLLAGDAGAWIIGVSGVLLLSNLALGLAVAWPRRGQWRRSLDPRGGRTPPARLFGWHRALGLVLVVPAMLLVTTGIERVFSDGFEALIGGNPPATPTTPGPSRVDLPTAVHAAWAQQPRARLGGVIFPAPGNATWQVRLDEPGEWSRTYGKSRIFVDGRDGRIIAAYDAPSASLAHRIADDILPVHTGEALGLAGRFAVLMLGAWLVAMMAIGASLWWVRRNLRRAARKAVP